MIEDELLNQLWLILIESQNSDNFATLGVLKKFLFVVERLGSPEIPSEMQNLFRIFKPF